MVLVTIVSLLSLISFVWVIYEVWAVNKKFSTTQKIVWSVFAIFFSIITAVVYFILEKN